jgi:integrase
VDAKLKGVTARKTSIQICFTYNRKRCRETLKIEPTKSNLKLAANKLSTIRYEIAIGKFDYLSHFPNSKSAIAKASRKACHISVEEALKDWLRHAQHRCEYSTMRGYGSAVYHYLIPNFGHYMLDELERKNIDNWITTARNKISAKRINNTLIPLRQIYKWAMDEELIKRNPMDRIRNLRVNTREPKPFTKDEIQRILLQLEGQEKNLIQFAFWSGLRTSELIALTWENVDLERNRIYVRQAIVHGKLKGTKTRSGNRTVELQDEAKSALEAQLAYTRKDAHVFHNPRTGKHWANDQVIRKVIWIPALKRAGIGYREPYQTRHTFASTLLCDGKNPLWVATQMGHSDWGMIRKVYGRWTKE